MRVMNNHEWFDENINHVEYSFESGCHEDIRQIGLASQNDNAIFITKEDVIALAKEFGLIVYEQDAAL